MEGEGRGDGRKLGDGDFIGGFDCSSLVAGNKSFLPAGCSLSGKGRSCGGPFTISTCPDPRVGNGRIMEPGIGLRSSSVNFCLNIVHSIRASFSSLSAALVASQFSCAFFSFDAICARKSRSALLISCFKSSIWDLGEKKRKKVKKVTFIVL